MEDQSINQPIPSGHIRLPKSERTPRYGAQLAGPVSPDETLTLSIRVRRKTGAPALPDMDYWAKTPLSQRKYMSREILPNNTGHPRTISTKYRLLQDQTASP